MASKSCAASECFGAAREVAYIWTLSGVDSAMPCQGRGVTECLLTNVTLVRLFSSVDTHVDGECRALNELLTTNTADIWTNTSVNSFVAN